MSDQRSPEWFAARLGKWTASRMGDLMATTKSGPSTSRANLIATLAVERLTGVPVETYTNAAMQRGNDLEADARENYAFSRELTVATSGFIDHPAIPMCGCSPDGLIGADGLVEFKCPSAMAKHVAALRSGDHAREYRWQLQMQLFVTGRAWEDAVSYHPAFPSGLQLAVVRVTPDPQAFEALTTQIALAEAEVQALVDELRMRAAA